MRDILQQFNVGSFQGYYYAKPMPGADYEERMRTGVKHVEDKTEEKPEEKAKEKTASV